MPHTVQPLGHALAALCRVHAWWNDVLLGLRPSLPNLRRRWPFFVRLVHGYYDAVRLLLNVHVRRSVYGLRGPVLLWKPRRPGALSVLVHVVSQRARVLTTTQDRAIHSRLTWLFVLPSSSQDGVGVLKHAFFEAQSHRPLMPLSTLRSAPRDADRKTRGQDGFATLLSRRALSSPTTCRFIPTLPG